MMELPESYREGFRQKDKISDISSPKLSLLVSLDNLGLEIQLISYFYKNTCHKPTLAGFIIEGPHGVYTVQYTAQ